MRPAKRKDREGLGLALWFALVFLINLAWIGALIYLVVVVAHWIARQP